MSEPKKKSARRKPKGIDPKTCKPYEPVKRRAWDALLKRAAKTSRGH